MLEHIASAAAAAKTTAYGMVLADLSNPKACLPPGFSSPVSTALGWVKALGLVVAIVALIRIGVHVLRQQGDGVRTGTTRSTSSSTGSSASSSSPAPWRS